MIKQLYTRGHLLKVARRSDSGDDWPNYRVARNKAVSFMRWAKCEFYNNSFGDNKNNARAIWKTIKTLNGSKRSAQQITSLRVDGLDVDDATEMADQFDLHFSTIADKVPSGPSSIPTDLSKLVSFVESRKDPKECFSVPTISGVQVKNIIMKINAHKSSGIDKINARLLRSSSAAVAPSIARLIN